VGLRTAIDPSSEPTPPGRTVLDWVGIVLFGVLGLPLMLACASVLYEGFWFTRAPDRLVTVLSGLICAGVPGGLFWWRAWWIFTRRRWAWRRSMRVKRRICIRCGYDLRGGVEICPECGMPVPEPIDRIAARLEAMLRRPDETRNSDGGGDYRGGDGS
jgi:hypothetical protein